MPSQSRIAKLSRGFLLIAAAITAVSASSAAPKPGTVRDGFRPGPDYPTAIERPDTPAACSFTAPLCVHAADGIAPTTILRALSDLEAARRGLVDALGLPAPLDDGRLGGGPAFDLYLVDALPAPGAPPRAPPPASRGWLAARDEPRPLESDRASAFGLVDRRILSGCAGTNAIASAYAAAAGWGIDAAEEPTIRDGRAAYLASLAAPCRATELELVDDFQAHPERALTTPSEATGTSSAYLFPWYLDDALGAGAPGALPVALSFLARPRTPAGSASWVDEPDLFGVLRSVLKPRKPQVTLSDLLLDFAVTRAFAGDREDGRHLVDTAWMGAAARPRFEWSVPFASLPRRLAPARPIEPTGATFLWVDLAGAPAGARLAFRAEWELPIVFRWAIVRVAADGSEASRVVVTDQDGSTSADRTVDQLDGLAGLIIAGTNLGDWDRSHPFDPNETPFEPHAYVVTLAAE